MNLIPIFLKELEMEAQITRTMFQRLPEDQYDWQPHDKSMKLSVLAAHVAEVIGWIGSILTTSELDFATMPYEPKQLPSNAELLTFMEENLAYAQKELQAATEELLLENWTMRDGEQIFIQSPKHENVRHSLSQLIHHRAQLGVYLRLLDVPVPVSYGPTADEQQMVF